MFRTRPPMYDRLQRRNNSHGVFPIGTNIAEVSQFKNSTCVLGCRSWVGRWRCVHLSVEASCEQAFQSRTAEAKPPG